MNSSKSGPFSRSGPLVLPRRIVVRVPASTSNLGPGYDCLGLALRLHNRFEVVPLPPGELVFETDGPERIDLPSDRSNVFVQAAETLWKRLATGRLPPQPKPEHSAPSGRSPRGETPRVSGRVSGRIPRSVPPGGLPPMPGLRVRATMHVPATRGLGSSTTALLAGLATANALAGSPLSREDLLPLAGAFERHPDNIAPSLLGGLCAGAMGPDHTVRYVRRRLHRSVGCVVLVPDRPLPTEHARRALPGAVAHTDAVFNLSRVPLVFDRLATGRLDDLAWLMEDRLHEPFRKPLLPGFDAIVAAGRRAGAAAVVLSGAGSTMIAFAPRDRTEAVAASMLRALRRAGQSGKVLTLEPDNAGLTLRITAAKPPGRASKS